MFVRFLARLLQGAGRDAPWLGYRRWWSSVLRGWKSLEWQKLHRSGRGLSGRHGMCLPKVAWLTSIPSLSGMLGKYKIQRNLREV